MQTRMDDREPFQLASPTSAWLRNAVFVALIVLIGMCGYFVYRFSMVMYRIEEVVVMVSSDVKDVTSTMGALSRDVAAIREDITSFREKAQESLPYEEIRHAIEEALAISAAATSDQANLSSASEKEIAALLKSLLFSGYTAEVGGRTQSVVALYGQIYGKYRMKRNTLTSAEDFIEQVATKNMLGKEYYIFDKTEKRLLLADWMKERLKQMRENERP